MGGTRGCGGGRKVAQGASRGAGGEARRRQGELSRVEHRILGDGGGVAALAECELNEEFFAGIKGEFGNLQFEVLGFSRFERKGHITRHDIGLQIGADDIVQTVISQRAEVAEIGNISASGNSVCHLATISPRRF